MEIVHSTKEKVGNSSSLKNWNHKYNRPTVGQLIYDIRMNNVPPNTRSVVEIQKAKQKEYIKDLIEVVEESKKVALSDFYIHVETKIEPLMPEISQTYFKAKYDCPTPNYDQSVFFYNKNDDRIEFVWTIPDRETCKYILKYKNDLPEEEKDLINFVIRFKNKDLFREMKIRNGEKKDSPLLDK